MIGNHKWMCRYLGQYLGSLMILLGGRAVKIINEVGLRIVLPDVGFFFFQAEDGIRDADVTGVQTCALPICGGQFMLGLDDGNARTLLILSALLFALCLLPVALTRAMVPSPMEAVSFNMGRLFRVAPHAVYGCLAAGLVTGAFYALGPTYAFEQQESSSFVGLFMGLTIFGGLLLQWPFGYLSDHFKRRTILRILSAALGAISIGLLFVSHYQAWSVFLAALWGGVAFTIYPISVAYANDRISPEESVPAAGVLLMAYSGGAAVGPILASGVMHITGTSGLFLFSAATAMVLSLLEARRRGAKKVSVDDQGDYIPVPRTSVVINQLDPRAEEEVDEDQVEIIDDTI